MLILQLGEVNLGQILERFVEEGLKHHTVGLGCLNDEEEVLEETGLIPQDWRTISAQVIADYARNGIDYDLIIAHAPFVDRESRSVGCLTRFYKLRD